MPNYTVKNYVDAENIFGFSFFLHMFYTDSMRTWKSVTPML